MSTLFATLFAALVVVLKKFNVIPEQYDALVASVGALLVQIGVLALTNYPQYTDTVTLVVNVLIAMLGAIGASQLGKAANQTKAAARALFIK